MFFREVKKMFLYEIDNQCEFALMAFEDLKQAVRERNARRIWYFIHAFLTAAGNISKLLWKSKGDSKEYIERKDLLKTSLCISDQSPLKNRTLRNYLEHFDGKLQKWVETRTSEKYVDLSFGSLDEVKKIHPSSDLENFLRYFDDTKLVIFFCGDEGNLSLIVKAIMELKKKVKGEIENLTRENRKEQACKFC